MDYSTVIVSLVSALLGFILALLALWSKNKLNKKILSKMDNKKVKRAIFKDGETILEMESEYEKLRKKLEEDERTELDNLVLKLKEIADQYASLYFRERNLLAETSEIWKDQKKTLEDYYTDLMKEYEKFSCFNCWSKYKLFWGSNAKKMEEKIAKEKNICRRCSNAIVQNNNLEWNKGKKKFKEHFQLDTDISDEFFNNLCRNCSDVLLNVTLAIYNYKKTALRKPVKGLGLGRIGNWEVDTENQIIKVWEGDEFWEINWENQNLNDILKYMKF